MWYTFTYSLSRMGNLVTDRLLRALPAVLRWGPHVMAVGVLLAVAGYLVLPTSALIARVPAPNRPPAGTLPWLSVTGGRIVDDEGRTVLLRGFNSEALLEYPDHESAPLDPTDLDLMRQSGFDVVRLPISWSSLEPVRGRLNGAYLDTIVRLVDTVNAHGLYVILDMHFSVSWSVRFGGAGAPAWAYLPRFPDFHRSPSWQLGVLFNPASTAATTYFWTSGDWQSDFLWVWRAVAARLGDRSGLVGYDLRNEPHPLPIPPRAFDDRYLWPFYQRTIEAIAGVDSNHLYLVEADSWGTGGTTVRPLRAPNLVYSPHVYYGSFTPPAFDGTATGLRSYLRARVDEARRLRAPAWVGETGFDTQEPEATRFADESLDAYDDLGIGWCWWQWRQTGAWGIRSLSGNSVNVAFLRHLARPFLAVAPAGVRGGRGDGLAGRLEIGVAAAHGAGPVEVSWPALTLPDPAASGTCLERATWRPDLARLVLDLQPGVACRIEVWATAAR